MSNRWYTWVALVCAIWFALTSWFWAYLTNIFLSYPFGLIALALFFLGKKHNPGTGLNKWVLALLVLGWFSSITTFMIFM